MNCKVSFSLVGVISVWLTGLKESTNELQLVLALR